MTPSHEEEKLLEEFKNHFPKGTMGCAVRGSRPEIESFLLKATQEAEERGRLAERKRIEGIVEESKWICDIHGIPEYKKDDCSECNDVRAINVILDNLLSALSKEEKI